MKIGCCLPGASFMPQGVKNIPVDVHKIIQNSTKIARTIGFDYTEIGAGFLDHLTEQGFEKLKQRAAENDFFVEAVNSFIPEDLPILDRIKKSKVEEYVQKIFERASALNIGLVIFGSGRARCIPYNQSREEGIEGIKEFLTMCNEFGKKYSVVTAIEPLNHEESNVFNTVKESGDFVRELGLENIKIIADCFHMWFENESLDVLDEYKDIIVHAHISDPPDRRYPGCNGGEFAKEFINKLKETGYDGRISAECKYLDFMQEMHPTYAFMKENIL